MNTKYIKRFTFVIISLLLVVFICRFTIIYDEDYSLQLIHNSFLNIIEIDSFDVHPPLYYFLLKLFLSITTFWTSSFFVKILFSRILSAIISIITFYFLVKISSKVLIKNETFTQFILFLMVPGVILFTYEFIKIRMYSLGAMFVVIEFYKLINYNIDHKKINLTIAVLASIGSVYTNYYSGIISGLILLIYMFRLIFNKSKYWHNIFYSGIILIISFFPWLPIFIKQLKFAGKHPQIDFLKQWIATLVLIAIFIYPLLWSYKHMDYKINILFVESFIILLGLYLIMSIISVFFGSVLQFRYLYPIYIIYGYLGLNIFVIMFKHCNNLFRKLISMLVLVLLGLSTSVAYIDQELDFGRSSIKIVRLRQSSYFNKEKRINLK